MATLQLHFAEYLHPLPFSAPLDGSLYLSEINPDTDPDSRNDLRFILSASENITNLSIDDISVSVDSDDLDTDTEPAKILALRGKNSVYEIIVRPPSPLSATVNDTDITGALTLTIAENAVLEGNAETIATFKYSNIVPDAAWQNVFVTTETYEDIVAVTRNRVILLFENALHFLMHDGVPQPSEQLTFGSNPTVETVLRYAPQKYLGLSTDDDIAYLLDTDGNAEWESAAIWMLQTQNIVDWALDSVRRRLFVSNLRASNPPDFATLPMDTLHKAVQAGDDLSNIRFARFSLDNGEMEVPLWSKTVRLAADKGNLYIATNEIGTSNFLYTYDAEGLLIPSSRMLIPDTDNTLGIYVFENHLYRYSQDNQLTRVDLSTLSLPHPMTNIYPQIVTAGDRIDLRKFCRYANTFTFEIGFDKPDWVDIVDNRWLEIADDVPPETTALIRLRAINQNGISPENALYFYIYVERLRQVAWKKFSVLNMFSDQELNMFAYCDDADMIDWQHGFRVPTDIEIADGIIGVTGDNYEAINTIKLRARTRQGTFADITFTLNIFSSDSIKAFTPNTSFRYRAMIEGVQLQANHVLATSNITSSLDWVTPNVFKRGEAEIQLRSNQGYYNSEIDGNFWSENNLNRNGYLNRVCLLLEALENGSWVSQGVIFEGIILDWQESIKNIQVTLGCVDNTYLLRQTSLIGKGLGKPMLAQLYPPIDPVSTVAEGIYSPETGGTPLNVDRDAKVYAHTNPLALKETINPPEGVVVDNTAYLAETQLKTQGGLLEDMPAVLLDFKTAYRRRKAHAIVDALAKVGEVYSVETDFEETYAKAAHISSNGNIAFNVADGRVVRYPVDWVHDSTDDRLYILLSNPHNSIADQLVEYDVVKDKERVLQEFDTSAAVLSIATADYDTFYVLTAPAIDIDVDRTADPVEVDTDTLTLDYDTAEGTGAEILRYKHSDDHLSTHVAADDTYPPQVSLHYWVGFDGEDYLWQGIQPSSRPAFEMHNGELYYRYVTASQFGVASVDADGSTTAVYSADRDAYLNHLNFAFDIDAAGEVYFGYTVGTTTDATLIIKDTSRTLFARQELVCNLTVLDTDGGAWLGVYELLVHDGFCYLIVPVARNNRDIDRSAGAVLYRYGLETLQLQVHDTWDFAHWGATSLALHDDQIYYLESPDVSYKFAPRNDGLDSWDTEAQENILPDAKGFLKRIPVPGAPDLKPETVGNAWFESQAFRGTGMKALSFNDALHFVMAEGDPEAIGQRLSDTSRPTNFQWLTFGKKLNYRLDIPTSGTLYDVLADIALKTHSTFVMDRGIISIRTRTVIGALTDGSLTDTASQIAYDNANKVFPSSGYLRIGDEILGYTGKTETELTGLTRGVGGTTPAPHSDDQEILFSHHVVDKDMISGDIQLGLDWNQLYNVVRDAGRNVNKVDNESLEAFGERIFGLNLNLDAHNIAWIDFAADQYVERLKDIQHYLTFNLQPNFSIRVADIIAFHYAGLLIPLQAMEVTANINGVRIIGRQVTANIAPEAEAQRIDPTESFDILSGDGNPVLVDGAGNTAIFWGDERNAIDKAPAFAADASIADQSWTQYQQITPVQMPKVIDDGNGDVEYSLESVAEGIYLDARLRIVGAPQDAKSATAIYRATDKEGKTVELMFDTTATAVSIQSMRTLSGTGDPVLVDGAGNVAIYEG